MKTNYFRALCLTALVLFSCMNLRSQIAISSVEDLQKIGIDADYPVSGNYYLTNDIDLASVDNWIPVGATSVTDGNPAHFTGSLDGRGYSIKNMKISTTVNIRGLFGRLNHATIKDLNLVNVDINGAEIVGGVAGAMFGESLIQRVSVSGNITGTTVVGGIAGRIPQNPVNQGYNIVEDCYVTANVTATSLSTNMDAPSCVGGIAGFSVGATNDGGVTCYGKIEVRRTYVSGRIISQQMNNVAGNAAGILSFYNNHNFVKMNEVIVLADSIGAATPALFFCRRGPTYDQFEQFEKAYARTGINLSYLDNNNKGRGGEIPDGVVNYNPAETYKSEEFYADNLSWDFHNVWTITEGEYPVLIDARMRSDSTLASLEVAGFSISPGFDAENTDYALTVSHDVESITINAVAGFKGADITGIGEQALAYGKNVFTIQVTALNGSTQDYTLIVTREGPVPEALYIIGGPLNAHYPNWMLSDIVALEADAENPAIFHYKGYLAFNTFGDEPGSLKFLTGQNWDPAYHPQGASDVSLLQALKTPLAMRLGGDDTKWTLAGDGTENGYCEISLNTKDLTICVDSFRLLEESYPAKIFITGDAMPCGWTIDSPEAMTPDADRYGVYSWTGTVSAGPFKFLQAWGSWNLCYVATTENEAIVPGQPHALIFEKDYSSGGGNDYKFVVSEAGTYTLTVDLSAMTLTVFTPEDLANADLASLTLSVGDLTPAFDPATTDYTALLPYGTTEVTPSATTAISAATLAGLEAVNVSSGTGASTITVTAADGTTVKPYTVAYTVAGGTGIINAFGENVTYTVVDRELTLTGAGAVYAVSGIKVADLQANSAAVSVRLLPGIYILKIGETSTKIVIR
jgi:hypothetical protein